MSSTRVSYALSLHDALPIYLAARSPAGEIAFRADWLTRLIPKIADARIVRDQVRHRIRAVINDNQFFFRIILGEKISNCSRDRKSTRLNSSHLVISYAVFCL